MGNNKISRETSLIKSNLRLIKEGIVFKISQDTFWFMTEGEKRELDYSVVGHQLFFTRKGAGMKNHE